MAWKSNPTLTLSDENYLKIIVQWYKPCIRRSYESNPYLNWDSTDQFKWEQDVKYIEQWTTIENILTSWKTRCTSDGSIISIPKRKIMIAKSITSVENVGAQVSDSESERE